MFYNTLKMAAAASIAASVALTSERGEAAPVTVMFTAEDLTFSDSRLFYRVLGIEDGQPLYGSFTYDTSANTTKFIDYGTKQHREYEIENFLVSTNNNLNNPIFIYSPTSRDTLTVQDYLQHEGADQARISTFDQFFSGTYNIRTTLSFYETTNPYGDLLSSTELPDFLALSNTTGSASYFRIELLNTYGTQQNYLLGYAESANVTLTPAPVPLPGTAGLTAMSLTILMAMTAGRCNLRHRSLIAKARKRQAVRLSWA